MESLFNFVSLRPADDRPFRGATLASDSDFQRELAAAADNADPLARAREVSAAFLNSRGAGDLGRTPMAPRLLAALNDALDKRDLRATDLREIFTETLGSLPALARSAEFTALLQRLRDTVVASYFASGPAGDLERLARAALIASRASSDSFADDEVEVLLRGPLALPPFVEALRRQTIVEPPPPVDPTAEAHRVAAEVEELRQKLVDLQRARADIRLVQMDELLVQDEGPARPLITLFTSRARDAVEPRQPKRMETEPAVESTLLSRVGANHNVFMSTKAIGTLPATTSRALRSLDVDIASTSVRDLDIAIDGQIGGMTKLIFEKVQYVNQLTGVGLNFPKLSFDPIDDPEQEDAPWMPALPKLPTTHGTAKPLGVADLLLVKSQLLRYERAAVAQVESLIPGSKLTVSERDSHTEEVTVTEESEQTSFESEARHVSEENSGTSSRPVSPGYGPVNEGKDTSEFAQNVTRDAARNTSARTRRQTTRRTLNEHEQRREITFDTPTDADPGHAVYQWLDKVQQAQVFNYGQRLLYDLIVPEPAALFSRAVVAQAAGTLPLVRPAVFRTDPSRIDESNWTYYVAGHGASGVEPPPSETIVVTHVFCDKAPNPFSADLNVSSILKGEAVQVRIPKGYEARQARVRIASSGWSSFAFIVTVGTRAFYFDHGYQENTLRGERESIPVGIVIDNNGVQAAYSEMAVSVEIVCERTADAFAGWQSKTHGAILEANKRRLRDYEERKANRDASARLTLQALDAPRKKRLIMTEIKRSALSVLTNQDFSGFNAISTDGFTLPQPNLAAIDQLSAYIRFFEQAIEWEHVGHVCFPYFWGRKAKWIERLMSDEADADFAAFLQAGAARVVLPVRPGYEAALERFMATGLTPTTDELLNVGGPLWVTVVDQLRQRDAAPGRETAVGTPWEIRTPAELTWARPDGSMPSWQLVAGAWVEQPDPAF